jgi:plasmid stabilization system protein ParE
MSRFVFSLAARRDLHDIWDYIAQDSVSAADRFCGRIRRAIEKLARMPGLMKRPPSIRGEYQRCGATEFYRRHGSRYRNPHEPVVDRLIEEAVKTWSLDLDRVLDLACGSGEATIAIERLGAGTIVGADPFTAVAYRRRTGRTAERIGFEDIAAGALAGRHFSLIVCSFALHLVEPSRLPTIAYELSRVGDSLLILTPHKRPLLRPGWGWSLVGEIAVERVRARLHSAT